MPDTRFTTEGIRYTGSKREIIPRIITMIHKHCIDVDTVLDACAGTTRVSQALRKNGFSVTERIPMSLPGNDHNQRYLDTKRDRTGHLINKG